MAVKMSVILVAESDFSRSQASEKIFVREQDPLLIDSRPLLSVDRNENSKQLLITIDATSHNSPPGDHDYYTLKPEPEDDIAEPQYDIAEPDIQNDEAMTDFQDDYTVLQERKYNTSNNSNENNLETDLNKKEHYERIKLLQESNKRKTRIQLLQRKVKVLQGRLRRSKERQNRMKIICKTVKRYTKFSEIDNILSGRFKELCKTVPNTPKKLDYTSDVIKFAISLYYLSPKAYDFVKKYLDLPHTKILKKYLSNRTFIINLDE